MEWNRDKCIELIDEYKRHPELWNPQHGLYYNKYKKRDTWVAISQVMGCSPDDVKKKMDSMLSSFRREKSKGRKIIESSKGRKEMYISKWFAFKRMSFLIDKYEWKANCDYMKEVGNTEIFKDDGASNSASASSPKVNCILSPQLNGATLYNLEEVGNTEILFNQEVGNTDIFKDDGASNSASASSPKVNCILSPQLNGATLYNLEVRSKIKKRNISTSDEREDETFQMKKGICPKLKIVDECSSFGDFVGHKIRNLRTTRLRAIAQNRISNILFELEMSPENEDYPPTFPSLSTNLDNIFVTNGDNDEIKTELHIEDEMHQ